jgi:hypothetical protein
MSPFNKHTENQRYRVVLSSEQQSLGSPAVDT